MRTWNSHHARFATRPDDEPPRRQGAKKSGVRQGSSGTGGRVPVIMAFGVLASWRFMRSPKPRLPPAEPATGRLSRWCARLYDRAPELMASPRPTGDITAAQDRVGRRAVAAALAPWQQAIAAGLAEAHAPVGARPARDAGVPGAHAPIPGGAGPAAAAGLAKPRAPVGARPARGAGVPELHAPIRGAAEPAAAARPAKPGAPAGARRRAAPACQEPMHQFRVPPSPRRRPPGKTRCTSRRTPGARRRRPRSPCTNSGCRRAPLPRAA